MAKNKGYFKEAGLDVDIVAVAQAGAEQAVNNGVADFALSNLTNVSTYAVKGATIKQVLQVQQKPSAIWCSLASNTEIKSPKDFDGKTFATFGSNESDAVIRRMIQSDGGKGEFDKVTVGTSTFQTLSSNKADFGGFYATWEGVQADMYGPKLNCFTEPDYGVPGNADTIGVITSDKTISNNPELVKKFVQATKKGYEYAYSNPDDAAKILVKEAPDANLKLDFVKKSMKPLWTVSIGAIPPRSRMVRSRSVRTTLKAPSSILTSSLRKTPTPIRMTRWCTTLRKPRISPPTNS